MNVSSNILAKTVDERATITTTLTSSCHWKTLVPFCLRKKRPGKAFLTLTVNYRKIVQKNKLCHSKHKLNWAFKCIYLLDKLKEELLYNLINKLKSIFHGSFYRIGSKNI